MITGFSPCRYPPSPYFPQNIDKYRLSSEVPRKILSHMGLQVKIFIRNDLGKL